MKFLHLSDLHIGLKLLNRDLGEDQAYIFSQITDLARQEQPDAVLIAGDIYDKSVPSAEAVELFDRFLSGLTEALPEAEIMIISGNHDSAPRLNVFRSLLARRHVHMIGQPPRLPGERIEKVTLQDAWGPVHFYLLPFVKPSMVKGITGTDENGNNLSYPAALQALLDREEIDPNERNVIVSHQFYLPDDIDPANADRSDSEIRIVGNVDAIGSSLLAPFDYGALGHIHKPMSAGRETLRYCGTPLACSISEAGQQKGILAVEMQAKGDVRIRTLPLTPLRRVRVIRGLLEEVLLEACEDYVSVQLTDPEDLDVIDMQDRLRAAFPYLLEIRRELRQRPGELEDAVESTAAKDPFELCCEFLGDPGEEEQALLREVINAVLERRGEVRS